MAAISHWQNGSIFDRRFKSSTTFSRKSLVLTMVLSTLTHKKAISRLSSSASREGKRTSSALINVDTANS